MLGVVVDDVAGEQRHVPGRGVVVVAGQPGGVLEVGVVQPQAGGVLVHHVGEGRLAPGQVLGHRHAGVVAGGDDDPVEQVADGDLGVHLDDHLGTPRAPGVLAHPHHVVQADVAAVQLALDQVGGHQLGQAGRRQPLIGVVLDDHPAAVGIHQDPGAGRQLGRRRDHGLRLRLGHRHALGRGQGGDQQQAGQQHRQQPQAFEGKLFHGGESHQRSSGGKGRRSVSAVDDKALLEAGTAQLAPHGVDLVGTGHGAHPMGDDEDGFVFDEQHQHASSGEDTLDYPPSPHRHNAGA